MRNYLALIILALTAFGCADSASTSAGDRIQDLFAYKVGNEWTYHSQEFNEDGSTNRNDTTTQPIYGATTYQGHEAYYTMAGGHGLLYFDGTTDAYAVVEVGPTTDKKHQLHYPVPLGETYVLTDSLHGDGNLEKELLIMVNNNESFTTPAGTFNCKHFQWTRLYGKPPILDTNNEMNTVTQLYFAPGVGLVKEEDHHFDKNGNKYLGFVLELLSYKVTWP